MSIIRLISIIVILQYLLLSTTSQQLNIATAGAGYACGADPLTTRLASLVADRTCPEKKCL